MRRTLDIVAMTRATDHAAGAIERLREAVRRIGGASITPFDCGICGATHSSPSTDTDVVCRDCARAHSLCRKCGGDFETRERRRKWPAAVKS